MDVARGRDLILFSFSLLVALSSPLCAVVQLANTLLVHAGIHRQVKTVKQCNSTVFTQLYEALTGARVPGKKLQNKSTRNDF